MRYLRFAATLLGPALATAAAATPLEVALSADTSIELAGELVDDEQVAADHQGASVTVIDLPGLPAGVDLSAQHVRANGDWLLAFDVSTTLPSGGGSITVRPADVVLLSGGSYTLAMDADALGIPQGVGVDAYTELSPSEKLLSFDTSVALTGGITADDEDVVLLYGGSFTFWIDSSVAGVPEPLDLDALSYETGGNLLMSFDGSGAVVGVAFDDEDLVRLDATLQWSNAYDASSLYPGWEGGSDLDAVAIPEASQGLLLASGALLLAGAHRRRARNPGKENRECGS